jgi:hypothetical protein
MDFFLVFFYASHEVDIFHEGDLFESADFVKVLSPYENGLVTVGDSVETGTKAGAGGDVPEQRLIGIYFEVEGPGDVFRVLQNPVDFLESVGGQFCIGVQEDKDFAVSLGGAGVHLSGPAPIRGHLDYAAVPDGIYGPGRRVAVDDYYFASFRIGPRSQMLENRINMLLLIQSGDYD